MAATLQRFRSDDDLDRDLDLDLDLERFRSTRRPNSSISSTFMVNKRAQRRELMSVLKLVVDLIG